MKRLLILMLLLFCVFAVVAGTALLIKQWRTTGATGHSSSETVGASTSSMNSPLPFLGTPSPTNPLWMSLWAGSGWLVATLLSLVLIAQNRKWRAAFREREWLLLPASDAEHLHRRLEQTVNTLTATEAMLQNIHTATADGMQQLGSALTETRQEFQILRSEIDAKGSQIESMRMGNAFQVLRPALLTMIRAIGMVDEDTSHQRDVAQTLEGVRAELQEYLEDHGVNRYVPGLGVAHGDLDGVEISGTLQAAQPESRGTIAKVDRHGYVVRGAMGDDDILLPAKVHIFT